jgi:hypothetical protein
MIYIEWKPTPELNVEVLNDTAALYRYFDCTDNAEFLYRCVEQTISHDLPREIDYLRRHDEAMRRIMETVAMPDRLAENLLYFTRKTTEHLGKRDGKTRLQRRRMKRSRLLRRLCAMYSRISLDASDVF